MATAMTTPPSPDSNRLNKPMRRYALATLPLMLGILGAGLPAQAGAEGFRAFTGHGGPVMGVAVAPDGAQLLTASFDYSVGLWTIATEDAPQWLEGHDAAVNAVAFLPGGRAASAGDDMAVIVWDLTTASPLHRLDGHEGKVMAVAAAPDGVRVASASWDGTVRIWDSRSGDEVARYSPHAGPVSDVVWSPDGARLFTAGHDGTVQEIDAATGTILRRIAAHGFGVNHLALAPDESWLAYGALDGGTRVVGLSDDLPMLADLSLGRRPILGLALSPDADRLAVGDGEGYIMVTDTADWSILRDFRAATHGPIWALAFTGSGEGVIAGSVADEAFLWPVLSTAPPPRLADEPAEFQADPALMENGERQFVRKCAVCHTLTPDGARRAGPSLHGVFGRQAGGLEGYNYSPALREIDIIWTEATIDALFDIGPDNLTPGSKMPMQQITSAQDRTDLVAFLRRETEESD